MTILPKNFNTKELQLSSQRLASFYLWIDKGIMLISLLSLVAYFGVWKLGLAFDDYANIWRFTLLGMTDSFLDPRANRFPLWLFVILPRLLLGPVWLAHLIIILVHTISAIFIYKILNQFNFKGVALLTAVLFLLWPANAEALHWIGAAAPVFGVCLVLGGGLLFFKQRYALAALVAFTGYTFYEAIVFPGLVLHAMATLRSRLTWWQRGLYLGAQVSLYALFQFGRMLVSVDPKITQYATGLNNIKENALDLFFMSLGLASSRSVSWWWGIRSLATIPPDATQLLSWPFFILALFMTGVFSYAIFRLNQAHIAPLSLRATGLGLGVGLVGYVSGFLVFLIVTGNLMQIRYTYTAVPYLCFIMALLLIMLAYQSEHFVRLAGQALIVLIIGWALFRTWSNIEANYYPAWQISQRIQADVALTYQETGVHRIHVVDPPQVVGNGYTLTADWAYYSMGFVFISPDLLVTAYSVPEFIEETTKQAAAKDQAEIAAVVQRGWITFSEHPCVFLGWRDGKRVVTSLAYTPDRQFLLNCQTGLVEPSREAEGALEYKYHRLASKDFLRDFYPDPLLP